ncbi:MAG: sigma-70 domain-containing protein [Nitrospirota bacterium]
MVGTDETIHQLRGISRELARNMVQIPTPEEIAERTELSIEKVRRVIEVARRRKAISLGTAFGEGDSELVDLVTDEDTACPEDEFVQRRVVEQTRRLLATLTPREEEILRKCFGIGETIISRRFLISFEVQVS